MSPGESLEILCRGCAEVISREELRKKLSSDRPLRIKLGVDPTAPDIHLGHTVALQKLRQFQDLGHEGILIIGDFTAMIGDPSGRSATRPQLTHDAVLHNARTYQEQAFKVLDRAKTEVVFNGEWFKQMTFPDVIRLNSRVTLQQMLQREDFRERMDKAQPIRAHELQYPIMQGWDSVMIRADVELDPPAQAGIDTRHLQPGLPVEAQIRTGARSPLQWFLAPLTAQIGRALRDD
jgi:tyrosyl-tRNA synthetase